MKHAIVFSFVSLLSAASFCTSCKNPVGTTNPAANTASFSANEQPKIAFDYLGLGWCYYLEDTAYEAKAVDTKLTEYDDDVNMDTGVQTKRFYQIQFTMRRYLKAHPTALDRDVVTTWRKRNRDEGKLAAGSANSSTALEIEREISRTESALRKMKFDESACEQFGSRGSSQDAENALTQGAQGGKVSEWVLRCGADNGGIAPRSVVNTLSASEYAFVRKVLSEITTLPAYSHHVRAGAACQESLMQMDVSRGRLLRTETKKVF
jgi:hypothetical protein